MNDIEDIKILTINGIMLLITFSHLDIVLKTLLVVATLGYTVDKWISHRMDRKNNKNKKE
jgi:hypothetical protein